MKRLWILAAVALMPPAQQQQPVFRSTLDVVTVDVSVRTSGTPVAGLTAKDFILLDNGVPQTIEAVEMEEVPVDVSVLIDASEDVTIGLEHVHQDIARVARLLRPSDRLRVTTINGGVVDMVRARPASRFPALAPFTALRGLSSSHDGIGAALIRSGGQDRRHLIIAVTNGVDALSTLSAASVLQLAKESQAVLHIVQLDTELIVPVSIPPRYTTGRRRLESAKMNLSGVRPPQRLFWRPYADDNADINTLTQAAELTGGDAHLPGLFRGGAARLFDKVFEEYRRSYLLRYTPTGVKREGWHEISVTIPKYSGYEIRARRGYSIETPAAAPISAASNEAPSAPVATLDAAIDAYNRANYPLAQALARRINPADLIATFQKHGNPWPANPRREAAFAIELADTALRSRIAASRNAGRSLLETHRRLVRHPIEADAFERFWLWTALAMLEGANTPEITREFADYALTRFPDEPRFSLAKALAIDQSRAFDDSDGRAGAAHGAHVRELVAAYDAAIQFPETAAEARVRKAFFLHRIGRQADALKELDAATGDGTQGDVAIRYLRHLFRGRVLEALERYDEAIAAYESARGLDPRAQSPHVALMRLAVRTGNRDTAARLAEAIQTDVPPTVDPWWTYWLGDYRQYEVIVGRLRELSR